MQEYIDFFIDQKWYSVSWVVLFVMFIYSLLSNRISKFKTITQQEATQLINKQDAKILDVRSDEEFRKGHIVDAINLPLAKVKNNSFETIEKHKKGPIILVCNSGISSKQAAQFLVRAGYENVYNLYGGMADWKAANLPVVRKKKR